VKAKGGHHFTDEGEEIILKRYADEIEMPLGQVAQVEVGQQELCS
jgi:hypothetical protein